MMSNKLTQGPTRQHAAQPIGPLPTASDSRRARSGVASPYPGAETSLWPAMAVLAWLALSLLATLMAV